MNRFMILKGIPPKEKEYKDDIARDFDKQKYVPPGIYIPQTPMVPSPEPFGTPEPITLDLHSPSGRIISIPRNYVHVHNHGNQMEMHINLPHNVARVITEELFNRPEPYLNETLRLGRFDRPWPPEGRTGF